MRLSIVIILYLAAEIHIDMFDDRVEITSPGGMFGGSIQEYDIYSIRSMTNPVIADLFHRMKYMERRKWPTQNRQ